MFDIEVHFDDINISSIEKEDLITLQRWINSQQANCEEPLNIPLNLQELAERFIEYYMSENEFFLKIIKGNEFIGILKGRVEFKNQNEALIWCFVLDTDYRGIGLGTKVLNQILSYFKDSLGIMNFSTTVMEGSNRVMKFWSRNRFSVLRISKSFFNINGKSLDMFVLKRSDLKIMV